ncbi:MAG: hypothetical protein AAFN77_04460 [Planctomycetota bacterium]
MNLNIKPTKFIACLLFLMATCISSAHLKAQTQEVFSKEDKELAEFFEKAHSELDNALGLYDDAQDRPENKELAFYDFLSKTKESQERRVETYLDAAGEALGISSISRRRDKIAKLRERIAEQRSNISFYNRRKVSAPVSTYNPLSVTKSGYQAKIESAKAEIENAEVEIENEKEKLITELQRIGLDLDRESIDNLLESITGDEFVRVSIIFNNAKMFAAELERLTNESGEDLETARKYYGVYLMLLKTVGRLQEQFIENVDNDYYPKLDQFSDQARKNIEEAKRAMRLGGDKQVLRSNIESNQLTYEAALFYKQGLAEQKHQMMLASLETKKRILTATNTYKTVELSKNVAELMATSRRAFDSITGLKVPNLRPFKNAKMKKAFSDLTRELKK